MGGTVGYRSNFPTLREAELAPAARPGGSRAEQIGAAGLDQDAILQRRAAEQHAEAHLVAIGKRELDRPRAVPELERRS